MIYQGFRIPKRMVERMEKIREASGMSKSTQVRVALIRFLREYQKNEQEDHFGLSSLMRM